MSVGVHGWTKIPKTHRKIALKKKEENKTLSSYDLLWGLESHSNVWRPCKIPEGRINTYGLFSVYEVRIEKEGGCFSCWTSDSTHRCYSFGALADFSFGFETFVRINVVFIRVYWSCVTHWIKSSSVHILLSQICQNFYGNLRLTFLFQNFLCL